MAAVGDATEALAIADAELKRHPADALARRDYNFALARLITALPRAKPDWWAAPLTVPTPSGPFVLAVKPDPRPEWSPARFRVTPADEIEIRGRYVTERMTRDGLGAPVIAIERKENKQARRDFAPSRLFYAATVSAHVEGRRCILAAHDPLTEETLQLHGRTYPLAADFSAPLAVMLEQTEPAKHELSRALNPEKFAHTAAIERLQPYDPNKTIVLVIHGLMDSQATWIPMINKLRGDPLIRRHYQFWFYSYPSGYPYPYSAAILRHELDEIERRYPPRKPMVVIGHSMGGCISRLLLTESGDKLCSSIFGCPLEQVPLSGHAREYFRDELFFHHRPEIGRVIFIAAPLRGSNLAKGVIGRIGAMLIRPARRAAEASREMLHLTSNRAIELRPKRRANSVDTLSPESRFVQAINTIPITRGVPYDTIVGDRGRGDSPNSSDGIVPYWSSYLAGAETAHIVPSGHSAHQDPQAIDAVQKILRTHAR